MTPTPGSRTPRRRAERWALYGGTAAIVGAMALGGLLLLAGNGPTAIDAAWMQAVLDLRMPWLEAPSHVLNRIGGGWVAQILVPVATILVLLLARRRWGALYFAAAVGVSALGVQLFKSIFSRPRPEEMLVASDVGSFPSGHVANAATLVVALAIIVARAWPWWIGGAYIVLMALSRTYLGVHWLTDTVGGALLGGGLAIVLWSPLAAGLASERRRLRALARATRRGPDGWLSGTGNG